MYPGYIAVPKTAQNTSYLPPSANHLFIAGSAHDVAARRNRSEVTLHYVLKHISARAGADIWNQIRTHLHNVHAGGVRSYVLDVGCGTGIFCYDLAKDEQ